MEKHVVSKRKPRHLPLQIPVQVPPEHSAKQAGLKYLTDDSPGFSRKRVGKNFRILDQQGRTVKDPEHLARVRSLAIPPAWTEVWISPFPTGHLQATGKDTRGRKQYRYHPEWRKTRDEAKFGRMMVFGQALPKIRERVEKDLSLPGLPRHKVLATVVRLLETTFIRVGNEEYARTNKSFGLTTMQNRHVDVSGSTVDFHFRGKSGKYHKILLSDRRIARIVKQCRELPGSELFQYVDESGKNQTIDSGDVNQYLKEISGEDFTAKDFRTWAGTMLAALALEEIQDVDKEARTKKNILRAIESVAERLGNTPTICRKCYIHPAIFDHYLDGTLLEALKNRVDKAVAANALATLKPEESAVLALLSRRLHEESALLH